MVKIREAIVVEGKYDKNKKMVCHDDVYDDGSA